MAAPALREIPGKNSLGRHLLIDAWGCSERVLNDAQAIAEMLHECARLEQATILETKVHRFDPRGVTAFVLLAESHLSIHTWPEHGGFCADFLFCSGKGEAALAHLLACMSPERHTLQVANRLEFATA